MSNNIFEELPSRKGGEAKPGADAAAGIEKKARQLVYDSRYEVKKMQEQDKWFLRKPLLQKTLFL